MYKLFNKYQNDSTLIETQIAIKSCKDMFEKNLAENLSLTRVSAPLFVTKNSGLNDNLNGYERPVTFDIKDLDQVVEIVQSLAKWKRWALNKYNFNIHSGLYTDMNAIRRDELLDNLHSCYVDQWDYELIINKEDRNIDYLKNIVTKITDAIYKTQTNINKLYPKLIPYFKDKTFFITSQELLDLYPNLSPKEREDKICKLHKQVFIIGIGDKLSNNEKHDSRAFDYDDWSLNGDLLVWYPLFNKAIEISSMGIRVDSNSLLKQVDKSNIRKSDLKIYHNKILYNELPLTIGGGIGQSRLCLVLLNKAHIGEVQASLWPKTMIDECIENNIYLL